jgi:(2R)-ethylmalonyl-CoA mutase
VEARTEEIATAAAAELGQILEQGGAFEAIALMKSRLVASQSERTRRIEAGELPVVGVNRFAGTEPSPLAGDEAVLTVGPAVEGALVEEVQRWRAGRDGAAVQAALDQLRRAAAGDENVMEASIALAHAGGTTGEWADTLRAEWGEFRAPTGVTHAATATGPFIEARGKVLAFSSAAGAPPRLLVAKPGLDGHSNGAEQIAVAARDAGFEVIYQGIRQTPEQIAATARDEDVDLIGLSILSGSHLDLVAAVTDHLRRIGVTAPMVVGGIIPPDDAARLRDMGVAAVYTPKDFELSRIVSELADLASPVR